ncbi:MAG TPA: DUF1439 domain-containing protein [Planctomycetota bacterium]|nr:DUF1439 domain-containing protein [Planctomycetota bacterium]
MLKKALFILGLGLVAAAAGVAWLFLGNTCVIELHQPELQRALEISFPVEKTYLHLIKVDLRDPVVTLRETSDRITFSVLIGVGLPGTHQPLRGSAELSCRIRYDAPRGAFFADDLKVERLTVDGHPEGYLEGTKGAVTWILQSVLDHSPVYTLRAQETRHALAKLILKDVRVKQGKLRLTLGLEP